MAREVTCTPGHEPKLAVVDERDAGNKRQATSWRVQEEKQAGDEYEDGNGDYEEYEDGEEEEEEEEVVMDEEDMLRMLDKMEPPLSVCRRLLKDIDDGNCGSPWYVLSASQRASLAQRGFVVVDGLAPASLAAEAYEEATARASSGSLAPAHGGHSMDTSQGGSSSYNAGGGGGGGGSGRRGDEQTNGHIAEEQNERGPRLTGYVRSVRDDLTAFVSSAGEKAAAAGPSCLSASGEGASRSGEVFQGTAAEEGQSARELGAIGRTLSVLARLGEDLGRMVRLRGRVEHQLAVYPAGIGARYERHRDAYPDDGEQGDAEQRDEDHEGAEKEEMEEEEGGEEGGEMSVGGAILKRSGSGGRCGGTVGESVSFRRLTAICYLRGNGSPWEASEGGALRLYPPASDSGAPRVTFNISQQEERLEAGQDAGQSSGFSNDAGVYGSGEVGDSGAPLTSSTSSAVAQVSSSCNGETGELAGGVGGGEQEFVDVAPLAGRAVVFFSGAVEHEVLPVTGPLPRAALTTWFH